MTEPPPIRVPTRPQPRPDSIVSPPGLELAEPAQPPLTWKEEVIGAGVYILGQVLTGLAFAGGIGLLMLIFSLLAWLRA